jgi:Kef-type K+ transport system membrane component KefB
MGLAPIVGAYAAGLILEEVHYEGFTRRGDRPLAELVRPIAGLLAPVFFVVMGLRVDLRAFLQPGVLVLTLALTLAALAGKQACALGAWRSRLDGRSIGIGMIPRGEVGLIFAGMGTALVLAGTPIISPPLYSALVVMVIVTTLVTPPALKWSLGRHARRGGPLTGPPDVDP